MDQKTDIAVQLPIIIEKCPICRKVFKGQSDYCELCGKTLTPVVGDHQIDISGHKNSQNCDKKITEEKPNKTQTIDNFFKRSTNYFVLLSVVGALISLLPVFLDIVIGPNWLRQLLGTNVGFYCLILLLITTYCGALFMLELIILICSIFYEEVLEGNDRLSEKIMSSIFLGIGITALGSLVGFLFLSWLTKLDYSINFSIMLMMLIGGILLIILGYFAVLVEILPKFSKRTHKIIIIVLIALVICIISYIIFPSILSLYGEIPKYYSPKSFTVNLSNDNYTILNETSIILPLIYSLPNHTGNFTFFDISYARCHWSTNYGFFITSNKNGTLIKRYEREIIIPKCPYTEDKIFWTYDIADYGKTKPAVRIGFVIEDDNQNKNIGEAYLNLLWNETKKDHIDNISSSLQ